MFCILRTSSSIFTFAVWLETSSDAAPDRVPLVERITKKKKAIAAEPAVRSAECIGSACGRGKSQRDLLLLHVLACLLSSWFHKNLREFRSFLCLLCAHSFFFWLRVVAFQEFFQVHFQAPQFKCLISTDNVIWKLQ